MIFIISFPHFRSEYIGLDAFIMSMVADLQARLTSSEVHVEDLKEESEGNIWQDDVQWVRAESEKGLILALITWPILA